MAGIDQVGLKGHSYVLPVDSVKSATTLISFLPRRDLRKHIMVGFMGTRELFKLVRNSPWYPGTNGCPIIGPDNMLFQRLTDRRTNDKVRF